MYKKIITLAFIALLTVSFAQQETVGLEFNYHSRNIDSLMTSSSLWSFSYRSTLPTNTRFMVTLGLDNVKFYQDDTSDDPILKSRNQMFGQLEVMQVLYYLYIKGAVQFYTINGNYYEATSGYSEIQHHNDYKVFEFPLSGGITLPTEKFDIYLGVNKTFLYGSNKQELIVNNGGTETSLGSAPRQTFKTDLAIGFEGTLVYHVSDALDLEIGAIKYSDKDFSLKVSIWGPLKHMSYMH